jgi:hypothetical protein
VLIRQSHQKKRRPPKGGLLARIRRFLGRYSRGFGFGSLLLAFVVTEPTLALFCFVILFTHIELYFAKAILLFSQTMKIWLAWFNTYLLPARFVRSVACSAVWGIMLVVVAGTVGCKTTQNKPSSKEASTLRLHLEVNPDGTPHTMSVPVFREKPSKVSVYREPFLTEGDIEEAAVADGIGGFAVKIQFNRHGAWLLENTTTSYRGRRIAVESEFGQKRWLAAPIIARRISDGLFLFTPDASREETERIVRGLNNVARQLKKKG